MLRSAATLLVNAHTTPSSKMMLRVDATRPGVFAVLSAEQVAFDLRTLIDICNFVMGIAISLQLGLNKLIPGS